MGDEVAATVFTREDRQRYREKVKRNLDVFARMLREARFDADKRSIGLEIELNLTEETGDPALANTHVLELIADDNFHSGARNGLDARLYWPGVGEAPAGELVLRKLLPMAREGLTRWGVDAVDADRLLEIIERRCVLGINGASW